MLYLDSSALVKLVVFEDETPALRRFMREYSGWISSALVSVELLRAARIRDGSSPARSQALLRRVTLLPIDSEVLATAANLHPPRLRTLDAIHVASALTLRDDLEALVTYDERMQEAGRLTGLPVVAPS